MEDGARKPGQTRIKQFSRLCWARLGLTNACRRRLTAAPERALTSFAAWFGNALRAAEPGCFTCRGGRQACGSPSPAQVSAALGFFNRIGWRRRMRKGIVRSLCMCYLPENGFGGVLACIVSDKCLYQSQLNRLEIAYRIAMNEG